MSIGSDSGINDALSSQSENQKCTINSITKIEIFAEFVKWIAPNIASDQVMRFIEWYFSGNFETGTEYQITIKQRLEPILPIIIKSNGDLIFADENGKTILNFCISSVRNYERVGYYDEKYDNILVTTLCKWGAQIIANDCEGNNPLRIALKKRRMDLVKTLVRFGYTTCSNSLGRNILHILVGEYSNDKTERRSPNRIIRGLISKRADFHESDRDGITPAHLAAKSLSMKLLKMFQKYGANLHPRTNIGDDLLILVCKSIGKQTNTSKALQLINWLLDQGLNVNSKNNNDFTPLHYASQSHQLAVVKTLVKAGADLHAVARDGTNCLHAAAMSDGFEIMQYLFERGVKSNLPDKVYGFTLIHMAVFSYNVKNFEWLTKNGFDSEDIRRTSSTLLHLASIIGNAKIIKKVIEHGADVNSQDKTYHHTALHFASMGGQFPTIQKMYAAKLNVNNIDVNLSLVASSFTRIKLQKATETDFESSILLLLHAGANVNAKDISNCTPLHYAIRQPNSYLVKILLNAGAHVDVQDNDCFTPLHYSFIKNNDLGLKYLLMFGANVNDIEHPHRDLPEEIRKSSCSVKYYLLRHVVKLKVANLPMNNVFGQYFENDTLKSYCIRHFGELEKLKEQMIAPDVSLYDFIHMNIRCRVKYVDSLPSDLQSEFPYYYVIIYGNEAINRNQLIEPAKIAFRRLTGLQWPDICVEHILTFLKNSTLRVLIEI